MPNATHLRWIAKITKIAKIIKIAKASIRDK